MSIRTWTALGLLIASNNMFVGCAQDLPSVVPDPDVRRAEPKDQEEWNTWKRARKLAKEKKLFQTVQSFLVDADRKLVPVTSSGQVRVKQGDVGGVQFDFTAHSDINSLPPNTQQLFVYDGDESQHRDVSHEFLTITRLEGTQFRATCSLKPLAKGSYAIVPGIMGQTPAIIRLTIE